MKYLLKLTADNKVSYYQTYDGDTAPDGFVLVASVPKIEKLGDELFYTPEKGVHIIRNEKKEKSIIEQQDNNSNYRKFMALWKDTTNERNKNEYFEQITRVYLNYKFTNRFEIEHKGLKAFFDQNKNDKTNNHDNN